MIEFPKKKIIAHVHVKYADYLETQAEKEQRSPSNIVMSALAWYQLLQETPGAFEAVQSLRPQHSKKEAPIPTMVDLANVINNLSK